MRPAKDYFERDEDGIRLKGHRIWLENILDLYKAGLSPERIRDEDHLSTLTPDEVEAAITYYHTHTSDVEAYLARQWQEAKERERVADEHPSSYALRMRTLLEERRRSGAAQA
jgi:uncharacterized protein (DUF433 family)